MAGGPSIRCSDRSDIQLFGPMRERSHCHGEGGSYVAGCFFLISSKISGKNIVEHHSKLTLLRLSSSFVATCPFIPKKQATVCFEMLLARTHFVGFG